MITISEAFAALCKGFLIAIGAMLAQAFEPVFAKIRESIAIAAIANI